MSIIVPRSLENKSLLEDANFPTDKVELNLENHLVDGLLVCCLPGKEKPENTKNLVTGRKPDFITGTLGLNDTDNGIEITGNTGGIAYDVSGLMSSPLTFTCFCFIKRTTDPNTNISMMALAASTSASDRLNVGVRGSSAGDPYNVFYKDSGTSYTLRPGTTQADVYMPIAVTRYAPDDLVVNYLGGSMNSANATFNPGVSIGDIPVETISFMGFYEGGSWTVDTDISMKLGLLWRSALSQTDIDDLFMNPSQLFKLI